MAVPHRGHDIVLERSDTTRPAKYSPRPVICNAGITELVRVQLRNG